MIRTAPVLLFTHELIICTVWECRYGPDTAASNTKSFFKSVSPRVLRCRIFGGSRVAFLTLRVSHVPAPAFPSSWI
jgi:hypothetical protein